jgi:ankyrin repeat protein
MMRRLITLGADPEDLDVDGTGAVLFATISRTLEAVRMLVELGIDVNVAPPDRPTALHRAIRVGEDEIVEYLAANGADFAARDHNGRTPLEEAEFEAPTHTIELMRRLAADRPGGGVR